MTEPLHILNGMVMYEVFQKRGFLNGEKMIPFNEAMCNGEAHEDIFSEAFIKIRANVHQVTVEDYKNITIQALKPLLTKQFSKLNLWFDSDMFCQINILTILGWLDESGYEEELTIIIVDSEFNPIETYTFQPSGYHSIYKKVLIDKKLPEENLIEPIQKGIELYLSHLQPDSEIIQFIEEHSHMSNEDLVTKLLANFSYYGLGDTQYNKIIELIRDNT